MRCLGAFFVLFLFAQALASTTVNFNFKGMIPEQGCNDCPECETCETCETCKVCSFVLLGSTTAEPLALPIADALTESTTFPCNGAYRGLGTTAGYSAGFAGLEVGLASRNPRSAEVNTIPASALNTTRLFAFGKAGTCIVVAANSTNTTVPLSWSKADFCAALVATGTRSVRMLGHNPAFSTHVQRLAAGCGVSASEVNYDEIVDTPTITATIAARADNWLGVIPPDELSSYLVNGDVQIVSIDGVNCLDVSYFAASYIWFVVNNVGSELTESFLEIARETLSGLNPAELGLAINPYAPDVTPTYAITAA